VVGIAVLLLGVAISALALWNDATLKDAEQSYTYNDWYGALASVAAIVAVLIGIWGLLLAAMLTPVLVLRNWWLRRNRRHV
jgi:hypothetical protein